MNRLFKLFVAAISVVIAFVGCDSVEEGKGTLPTISLIKGDVTENSLSFIISSSGAEECAYLLFDGDVITASEVFERGTKANVNGVVNVGNLDSNTTYHIVAAARNAAGEVISDVLTMKTSGTTITPPDDTDARTLNIVKTTDGRWYEENNYYVTFVADSGERIILDFYTIYETMSSYLPYGSYSLSTTNESYTLGAESSGIILEPGQTAEQGYLFTEGYCNVDVANGYYAIYFYFIYEVDGQSYPIQAVYNGPLSGASVPKGDDEGAKELIEVLEVGSTSFKFRINADEGQYWRCSVVDKRVYDQTASNPGAWVVTYGFMLEGTLTFNWENGKMCEHVPGYTMNVSSSTDYLILAALMDYSEGQENVLLGGVEIVQIHTEAEAAGTGTVDIDIKEVNKNDILFDCTLGENVWCCYVAMMETENLEEIKAGKYAIAGYETFEECMLSLIPSLAHDSMRQFLESQVDYRWEYLKYNTSYTLCVKVEDMNKGVSYMEFGPFTTNN